MYLLKEEYLEFFKEIRTKVYTNLLGCDTAFISSIVNGNKICSEVVAKAILSVRFDISCKDEKINEYLEKYFAKEK